MYMYMYTYMYLYMYIFMYCCFIVFIYFIYLFVHLFVNMSMYVIFLLKVVLLNHLVVPEGQLLITIFLFYWPYLAVIDPRSSDRLAIAPFLNLLMF